MQGVEFLAFAEDCTITAKVTMFGDRLTDFLNGQERFRLHQVAFESLEDGHVVPSTRCRSSGSTCSRSSPPVRAAPSTNG